MRRDDAVSDVVGTIVLIGITVSLVGVAVGALYSASNAQKKTLPPLDMKASAFASGPGNGAITLTHAGGSAFNRSDLDVEVSVAGVSYGRAPLAGSGAWDIGQAVTIPLSRPLAGGEHLDISVISRPLGAVVATGVVDVASAAAAPLPPGAFTIAAVSPLTPPPADAAPGSVLRVVANVSHVDGRNAIASVWIDLTAIHGQAVYELSDDGSGADDVAGDLSYAGFVTIPPDAPISDTPVSLPLGALDLDANFATPGAASSIQLHVILPSTILAGLLSNSTIGNITNLNAGNVTNTTVQTVTTFQSTNSNVNVGGAVQQFFSTNVTNATVEQSIYNFTGNVTTLVGNVSNVTLDTHFTNISDLNNLSFLGNLSNLTIINNGGAQGPPEIREPNPFAPTTAAGNTLVKLFGKNFTFVNSLRLIDSGGGSTGATWWILSDGEIDLIAPVVGAATDYKVSVANPIGTSTSIESIHVLIPANAPNSPPSITGMTPTHGFGGTEVTLTGQNLSFLTSVRIAAGANVYSTAFYVVSPAGVETHFFVPREAPPGLYTVTAGSPGGSSNAPVQFQVDPRPPGNQLTVTNFTPKQGPPFTQINLTGTGFLNVVAANVGGANVALWVTNDTTMQILTHPAVPTQRFNHITLFNTTGTYDVCCFDELPAPASNEYATYPTNNFTRMAFNLTKWLSNDTIGVSVKFNMTNATFVANGETFTFSSLTLETPNFKPGTSTTDSTVLATTTTGTNKVVCGPSGSPRNGVWVFFLTQAPKKYSSSSDTLPFLFWFEWTGSLGHSFDVSVGSSTSQTQDFTLGPQATSKIVKDGPNYDWPSSFQDCSNLP